jgi:hypothetical protein
MDGKYIRIKCPPNSGSQYFNYKQYNSIVLQAVVDANLTFLTLDVGAYGKQRWWSFPMFSSVSEFGNPKFEIA